MLIIAAKRVGSQSKVCSICPEGSRTFMAWQVPGMQTTHGLELTDPYQTVLNNLRQQGYMLTPALDLPVDDNPMTFAKQHARHFSQWINTGIPPKELVDLGIVLNS